MSELILSQAITKTDISAPAINANLDALEGVINGSLDGQFNISPGSIGASAGVDLNSHIAGSALTLSSNTLAVAGATTGNFGISANISPGQLAAGGLVAVAANVESGGQFAVVSNTNASGNLAIVRGGSTGGTGLSFDVGEGYTASIQLSTAQETYVTTVTFSNPFAVAPIVVAGFTAPATNTTIQYVPYPVTTTTTHTVLVYQIYQQINFIALGVV